MESNQNASDPVMSIGTLAEKVGLSVSAVRKYENACLMIAHRTASGHRLFSQEDVQRVRKIHQMVQNLGLNFEGIRRLQALLPCWELLPCNAKQRAVCPAFKDNTRPCWMIKGLNCARAEGADCRECLAYRFGSLRTDDIKSLIHTGTGSWDAGLAEKELADP